jgi:RNA polymerase sigma-70 factor (ECF subfamily)
LEAYIRQIARNIFTDWLQQTEKEKQQQADYAAEYLNGEHRTGGEDALNARMDLAVIVDMLAGVLPEKCCRAFVLSRFHGWSYQEIAEEMSISKDTVRNHMIKAKKILAKLGNLWKYP